MTIVATGFNGSQPAMLFGGGNGHYKERDGMFGRGGGGISLAGDTGPIGMKRSVISQPLSELGTILPPTSQGSFRGKESDDDLPPPTGSIQKGQPLSFTQDNKKKDVREAKESREKESDAWDIPAFLRKRKK